MRTAEHSARELGSRAARQRLPKRNRPYFANVDTGLSVGYRAGQSGGSWVARVLDAENKYRTKPLGKANDLLESVGLSFQQAQAAARLFAVHQTRLDAGEAVTGPYTVTEAAHEWLDNWKGSNSGKATAECNVRYHILPTLGRVEVSRLKREQIETWLRDISKLPPVKVQQRLASTKKLSPSRQSKVAYDPNDPETQRKRRDSANRVLNDLKAILNRAYANQKCTNRSVWDTVERLEGATAKTEYLSEDEAQRFITACPPDFRDFCQVALITGARYGELCELRVSAYDNRDNSVSILQSKTGKLKRIFLKQDEAQFFDRLIEGKASDDYVLRRFLGTKWSKSNQQYRMKNALRDAGINRPVTMHNLRHTFASLLLQNGATIEVVANQLGHSGTAITLKHYAHLSDQFIKDSVRKNKPSFLRA